MLNRRMVVWFAAMVLAGSAAAAVFMSVSGIWAAQPGSLAATPATASAPAASRPSSAPADALTKACSAEAEALRKRLGKECSVIDKCPFVVGGDLGADDLRAYLEASVQKPAEAMWKSYFAKKPNEVITVLLFNGDKPYRAYAKSLFGDEDVSHFGYYKPDKRTMVMNIATGGGTLVHELTHALIVYDFPDVPRWFNEGLGSLHEQCQIGPDSITGLVNWRLPLLQKTLEAGKLRPLAELVTADDFYGQKRDVNYSQARYFVMYMQKQGVLKDFYAYYRDHHEGEDSAVAAIEKVFGKKIDAVEKDYLDWVKDLRPQ